MTPIPYRLVPVKPVIYSVRHGESIGNVDRDIYDHISDPALWLTERGQEQARAAGAFLADHFVEMPANVRPPHIRIMRSSYRRAIQTAQNIEDALRARLPLSAVISVKEDTRLRELEFGYGGHMDEPLEAHVQLVNQLRYQGYRYLSTRLGGESPAHMEPRARSVLSAIFRDFQENGITHFIVVNHGITSRVLNYVRYNKPNSWYETEPNPDNCAIRLMADEDCGYIFPNDKGQWNPDWKDEAPDAGAERLNTHGQFFSPEDMEEIIRLQRTIPDIVKILAEMMRDDSKLTAAEALTAFKACYLPS